MKRFIFITGSQGSGKSTMAQKICKAQAAPALVLEETSESQIALSRFSPYEVIIAVVDKSEFVKYMSHLEASKALDGARWEVIDTDCTRYV